MILVCNDTLPIGTKKICIILLSCKLIFVFLAFKLYNFDTSIYLFIIYHICSHNIIFILDSTHYFNQHYS